MKRFVAISQIVFILLILPITYTIAFAENDINVFINNDVVYIDNISDFFGKVAIVGLYDYNNRFVGLASKHIDENTDTICIPLDRSIDYSSACIFIWNSLISLQPDSVKIPIYEKTFYKETDYENIYFLKMCNLGVNGLYNALSPDYINISKIAPVISDSERYAIAKKMYCMNSEYISLQEIRYCFYKACNDLSRPTSPTRPGIPHSSE